MTCLFFFFCALPLTPRFRIESTKSEFPSPHHPHHTHYHSIMTATHKEMADARLPLGYRDFCADLLIPLNKCRSETYYLPFKCQDLRHDYEKCQYDE